ncbi:TraX family protein [Prevotella histicola]
MVLYQWKGLSDSALKVIALVSMTVDHIAYYLMDHNTWGYDMMRTVGRMAFPIFAFLLVEGYGHTRSTRKYALSLLAFALISEIPWWLLNHDNTHNVFFTLLLGLIVIEGINKLGKKPLLWAVLIITICTIAIFLHVDYEYSGILLICTFHIFKPDMVTKCLLATLFMYQYGVIGLWLGLAVILCYNGQRGFIKGQYAKYLCYAYYPLHLVLFMLLSLVF